MTKGVVGTWQEEGCTRLWLLAHSPEKIDFALTSYLIKQVAHLYADLCNKGGCVYPQTVESIKHPFLE